MTTTSEETTPFPIIPINPIERLPIEWDNRIPIERERDPSDVIFIPREPSYRPERDPRDPIYLPPGRDRREPIYRPSIRDDKERRIDDWDLRRDRDRVRLPPPRERERDRDFIRRSEDRWIDDDFDFDLKFDPREIDFFPSPRDELRDPNFRMPSFDDIPVRNPRT